MTDTRFTTLICNHCADVFESAGQLMSCREADAIPEELCEQCGKPCGDLAYMADVEL